MQIIICRIQFQEPSISGLQSERVQWLRGNLAISDFSISHAPRQRFVGLNAACGSDCAVTEERATFR
jgi:hypothetical protein